jgi:uncharacterized protein (TIGR04222 family)
MFTLWTLALALGLTAAGCARFDATSPFDLAGPRFLVLFLLTRVATLAGAWLLSKRGARRIGQPTVELEPYQIAYLAGAQELALNGAIATLVAAQVLKFELKADTATGVLSRSGTLSRRAHPFDREVYERFANGDCTARDLRIESYRSLREIAARLQELALFTERGATGPFVVAMLAPLFGLVKLLVGIERGKPVGFLFAGCVLSIVVAFAAFRPRPGPTVRGKAWLESLRRRYALSPMKPVQSVTHEAGRTLAAHMSDNKYYVNYGLFCVGAK